MVLKVKTTQHKECIDITDKVRDFVRDTGVENGLCHVMALHATAGIIINENADPNICVDFIRALDQAVPEHDGWLHDRIDNNAQSHILSALIGPSESIPIRDNDLLLGTWQALMLVELDGPRRQRKIAVTIVQSAE